MQHGFVVRRKALIKDWYYFTVPHTNLCFIQQRMRAMGKERQRNRILKDSSGSYPLIHPQFFFFIWNVSSFFLGGGGEYNCCIEMCNFVVFSSHLWVFILTNLFLFFVMLNLKSVILSWCWFYFVNIIKSTRCNPSVVWSNVNCFSLVCATF